LHLSGDIISALLEHKGDIGQTLAAVSEFEAGELEKSLVLGLEANDITNAYMKSITWAESLSQAMSSLT
jgi:c-di-GMP-related signal transduction protein